MGDEMDALAIRRQSTKLVFVTKPLLGSRIHESLGIPTDQFQKGSLVKVDFPKPNELDLSVPSGNEWGANDQWIPGGKLPKGDDEAVISTKNLSSDNHSVTDLKSGKKIN